MELLCTVTVIEADRAIEQHIPHASYPVGAANFAQDHIRRIVCPIDGTIALAAERTRATSHWHVRWVGTAGSVSAGLDS